ncbi:hypothetical protein RFI_30714 [Reticulomyxa filosa]|uniref:Uncharacterized protein n=1 Tax=Reticulomyxa filosa TaxID=46433 RepID=X6LXK3_RETFI|nr:hypothetical protein RFI_30714 [Reticulomyxa filosa]|eukprot:ETO06678.1 hypothetical protein RFI_30714 [Reticulomyxa filosa]
MEKSLADCSKTDEIAQKLFTEKRFQKEDSKRKLEKALSEYTTNPTEGVKHQKEKKESLMENIGLLKKCDKSLVNCCSDLNTQMDNLNKKMSSFLNDVENLQSNDVLKSNKSQITNFIEMQ